MEKGGVCYFCTENQLVQNVLTGVVGVNFFKNLKIHIIVMLIIMLNPLTPL